MNYYEKKLMDRLTANPNLALSFDEKGIEVWQQRVSLTPRAIPKGERSIISTKPGMMSSDGLLVWLLRLNPGVELQLSNGKGLFPYLSLHVNGNETLEVLEGMFISEGKLCCLEYSTSRKVELAQINFG